MLGVGVPGAEALAAALAVAASVDEPVAALVADQHGRTARVGEVAIAPVEQGDHHGPQVEAPLGEEVLVAGGSLLVRPLLEDPLVDQPREPRGEHVAGDAEVLLDLVEPPVAVEDVADHEQGPALAEHLEGAGDRADLVVIAFEHECDLRTHGCITQLCLLPSVLSSNSASRRAAMRLVELPPITVSFTDEEILADLLYPAVAERR